ncbi:MAG: PqqD family protein [Bacteroidaceae bacterium]
MENRIIPKSGLKLRKIGRKHMIVETSDSCVNLSNVYSLNETAAWLWEAISDGGEHNPEELADRMCVIYNVEHDRALHDVECQIGEWEQMGLLVRQHTDD